MRSIIFTFLVLISLTTIIADNPITIELEAGKNNFTIEEYFPAMHISTLMEKYPEINSASLSEHGRTFGYANLMQGIGTNFLIESGKIYEIHVNESMTISLKE